jgi:hypothetical protein
MSQLKIIGLTLLATLAITAFAGAGSASATTLEVGGVPKNESVTITASLYQGGSVLLQDTAGVSQNTCTGSTIFGGSQSFFTSIYLTGYLTSLGFSGCMRPVTVHNQGALKIYWTWGTDGTVSSEEAEITTGSPLGTLTCTTGSATHLGTLTGVSSGHATMHVNANIDCGISAKLVTTYKITSPTGLGVSS